LVQEQVMAAAEGESSKRQAAGDASDSPAKIARVTGDDAAAEAELAQGCEELKKIVKNLQGLEAAGETNAPVVASLAALLRRLATLPVDANTLRSTGIGREVNQRWIRCHPDEGVQAASKALVHGWRAAAGGNASKAAATGKSDVGKAESGNQDAPKTTAAAAPKEKQRTEEKPKVEKKAPTDSDGKSTKAALAEAFKDLAGFYFKLKKQWHGCAYQKVSKVLSTMDEEISSVDQCKHLPGVGKASQKKIAEYLETGKILRLERYRNGDFEGED